MNKQTLIIACFFCSLSVHAQEITTLLRDIEKNNLSLQALRNDSRATILEMKSLNTLEAPSVEYSPFFKGGVSGVASSELIVSQQFDFPTQYAARRKAGQLQRVALDSDYAASRRDLLLSAQRKCLELVHLNRVRDILTERVANAQELQLLFQKKMDEGDATLIELNKVKMELMNLQSEMVQNEAERQTLVWDLRALNGNQPLSLDSISYPAIHSENDFAELRRTIVDGDAEIRAARAAVAVSEQEMRNGKQEWLPKLAVGYRRNTEMREASNGFLIGASVPLFSITNKVKAAKSKCVADQLRLANIRAQVETDTEAQISQLQQLDKALRTYDLDLMHQTLSLLKTAVTEGSLSLITYYMEIDDIYQKIQTYLAVENQYHVLWATLNKHCL